MGTQIIIKEQNKKRPNLLTLLCVLTFIGSGLQIVSNFFILPNKDFILQNIEAFAFNMEDFIPILEMPNEFFKLNVLFLVMSLTGAIFMWNLKKIGFHIYSLAQIALLFVLSIYNPFNNTPIAEIVITILFILFYFRQLKYMH